jgi:nucleoside-diphosphate-sugar epimerase
MDSVIRQRVLVLGAGGYIGTRVVAALAASDWAIPIAATHRTARRYAPNVETTRLDATAAAAMGQALHGVSAVVNCVAGEAETIVSAARALFDSCAAMTPQPRVVHLSTMSVYGTATGDVDETAALRGDANAYSAAKAEAERLARVCAFVVHLRPGIVYGPGSPIWSERIGRWLLSNRLGDLGAAGCGYCNLVHVDDVVEAILRSLRLPGIAGEAFNLSLTSPPTWNEYFRLYADALGVPFHAISRQRLLLELAVLAPPLLLAERAARLGGLRRQLPAPIRPWLLRLCRQRIRLDVHKAERMLGMKWTLLDQGLRDTAEQIRAQSQLVRDNHTIAR